MPKRSKYFLRLLYFQLSNLAPACRKDEQMDGWTARPMGSDVNANSDPQLTTENQLSWLVGVRCSKYNDIIE